MTASAHPTDVWTLFYELSLDSSNQMSKFCQSFTRSLIQCSLQDLTHPSQYPRLSQSIFERHSSPPIGLYRCVSYKSETITFSSQCCNAFSQAAAHCCCCTEGAGGSGNPASSSGTGIGPSGQGNILRLGGRAPFKNHFEHNCSRVLISFTNSSLEIV